jgi:outer membrane protein TolC
MTKKVDMIAVLDGQSIKAAGWGVTTAPVLPFCLRAAFLVLALIMMGPGCQSPAQYRREADRVARDIIREKQQEALHRTESFQIERPSNILRRKLLIEQDLPYFGPESLGTDRLPHIDHWPDRNYPATVFSPGPDLVVRPDKPVKLTLSQALQVAARNSFEYQGKKETIFRSALDLDLERYAFQNIFFGQFNSLLSTDGSGEERVSGAEASADAGWNRRLKNGSELSAALAIDLVKLLTAGRPSSLGVAADVSISIPLLRGSGRYIVMEPLTQAERNVIYAIYAFERFKHNFIVDVAQEYLSVLQQMDEVRNAEENYRSLITSALRSRRLAEAGRLPEIQVDQAVQDELRARNRWIVSTEQFKSRLDSFKNAIGLPPDARIEVDRTELERLRVRARKMVEEMAKRSVAGTAEATPPADGPIELAPPSHEDAGPQEIDETLAIRRALDHRLDLRIAAGSVYDAQRKVVVAADALRAELTLLGYANLGERRSIESAGSRNSSLRFDKGIYTALLTLDLPIERTPERNAFRESFIDLESTVRDFQALEDQIKLSIKDELRTLLASRESLKIQAQAVVVAQKRVKSSALFLEAGRAQVRDLLEAQEALFSAQNSLTAAVISYRVAELKLQSDMGLLEVDNTGPWRGISLEENHYGPRQ